MSNCHAGIQPTKNSSEAQEKVVSPQSIPDMNNLKKVAIIGLPNTGKTQIFNNLTGEYNIVANYPGTTIEMKRSVARINDQYYEIIDTPGLHCLYIHSEEEIAVRDMIFSERPDIIVQCIDASQYKQSFLLTAELLELETPMVVVLNSMDETARKGIWIDSVELEKRLGIPVVECIALRGLGKEELKKAIAKARTGSLDVKYGFQIENCINELTSVLPFDLDFKYKIASLYLLNDPFVEKYLESKFGAEKILSVRVAFNKFRRQLKGNVRQVITDKRSQWVNNLTETVVKQQKMIYQGFSHHFTQASRHPVLGIPIFLFFMAIVYLAVVYVSGAIDKFITFAAVTPVTGFINSWPLPVFWKDLLIGPHGILTLGVFNAICTVLPILTVFFFIFGCFEDSGYITNFTVLSKRIFAKIGIPGNAITSLVLGFGCKTMATLSTRSLTIPKEKFIAVFLIAFAIPCSAQLSISMAILARVGLSAFLIVLGALVVSEMGAGIILNKIIKGKTESCFIQVIPPMRFPSLRAVFIKTYYRIVSFLKEALPIFILSAAGLFIFDKTGLLAMTKQALTPMVVGWMGLPKDIIDVFLLALARREAAAGLILKMVDSHALNYIQSIVAVVVTTISFPCVANVIAIGKEMGWKTAVAMTVMIFATSFLLIGMLNGLLKVVCGV
ncbi:MAG: ferrous iron transport protein B [Candidatus Omnitrophica bacterium]|nr:ferrous iron transport protein B [Candidatus Omnitrophota bacterium]